jgi:60 kDa SS-A/Ro ribonucleoprotein
MTQVQAYADFLNGKTTTYEGGVAWKMSLKETVAEFFSLGLLNGMYYQSREEVMRDAAEIFSKALSECPEFAAKAAVYGHERNSLKLIPLIWAAYASTLEDKTLFNRVFPRLATNVNLLHDFVEICRKTPIRKGLGRGIKRAVNNQLHKLANEYSVSRNKTVIGEIAKVSRPLFKDEAFQSYMRYAAKDELAFNRAVELKRAIEKIAKNEVDDDVLFAIEKYHFQLEELKHAVTKDLGKEAKRALYASLYKSLRYAALILNLAALERVFAVETMTVQKRGKRGTFRQEAVIRTEIPADIEDMVCAKIRSTADYRASNMLPFVLISAQRMVTNEKFKTAIADVLNACAAETFELPWTEAGHAEIDILVGVDISGSMDVMVNDSLSARDISTFFGALLKLSVRKLSHQAVKVCALSNDCYPVVFKSESLFAMADEISCSGNHGCTYLGKLLKEYSDQKYVIILTDSETADDFEDKWKKTVRHKGAKLIVWQLQAYHVKLSNDPSVIYIAGFSDRQLSLVKAIIEDRGNMMEEIENVAL